METGTKHLNKQHKYFVVSGIFFLLACFDYDNCSMDSWIQPRMVSDEPRIASHMKSNETKKNKDINDFDLCAPTASHKQYLFEKER